MNDAIVELNSETREIFAPAARCEAKATAEAHVTRVPVRPAKHSCHEPTRPTSGRRNLARPSPSVDRSVQVTEHKASIGSLFAELYRTGKASRFEKATAAALAVAAAISISASFAAAEKLFTGWAAFERFVGRILF
jgi:hypothetical protein